MESTFTITVKHPEDFTLHVADIKQGMLSCIITRNGWAKTNGAVTEGTLAVKVESA